MQQKLIPVGLFLALAGCTTASYGQSQAGAQRAADIQVGVSYSSASSDYVTDRIRGFGFYGNIDVSDHWGLDLNFHELSDPQPTKVYERSYEVGVRYVIVHTRLLNPYVRVDYGRGVFNFPQDTGNLAYNMFDGAGGVDIKVHRRIHVRAEFEYQDWFSGPGLSDGLSPSMVTFGVAYHFPAGVARH